MWNRFLIGPLLFLIFCAWPPMARDSEQIAVKPEQISLYDAEILIYLLPQAHEIRKEGMDIGWELETSPKLNQEDFYTFWVVNAKRKHVNGSVTVGYFSVNKHTADIVDNLVEPVTSPELAGVQRILREGHHIDSAAIQKYRSRNPNAPSGPG